MAALLDLAQRRRLLVGRLGGADPDRAQPRQVPLVERGDLVLLQRQQRGDHHGRPGQQRGRYLVDGRLAGPGGQHDQRVAPAQHGSHRLELAGAQGRPAELLTSDPSQTWSVDRQLHGAGHCARWV
jgi:hypothetical protein